jgi:hypothetical protein
MLVHLTIFCSFHSKRDWSIFFLQNRVFDTFINIIFMQKKTLVYVLPYATNRLLNTLSLKKVFYNM